MGRHGEYTKPKPEPVEPPTWPPSPPADNEVLVDADHQVLMRFQGQWVPIGSLPSDVVRALADFDTQTLLLRAAAREVTRIDFQRVIAEEMVLGQARDMSIAETAKAASLRVVSILDGARV